MRLVPIILAVVSMSSGAVGAEATAPLLSFAPVYVRVAQQFQVENNKETTSDQQLRQRMFVRDPYGRSTPGCDVGIELTGPKGWRPLRVLPAVVADAKTDAGETLAAVPDDKNMRYVTSRQSIMSVIYGRAYVEKLGVAPQAEMIIARLAAPSKAATKISSLRGSVDLVYAEDAALKTQELKTADGGRLELSGIDDCDLAFIPGEAGNMTVEFSGRSLEVVKTIDYRDADGNQCTMSHLSSANSSDGGKQAYKIAFSPAMPATITVQCYSGLKPVRVVFALSDIPLIGSGSPDVTTPKAAVSIETIEMPVPETVETPTIRRPPVQSRSGL
jgi:hypothetical protein